MTLRKKTFDDNSRYVCKKASVLPTDITANTENKTERKYVSRVDPSLRKRTRKLIEDNKSLIKKLLAKDWEFVNELRSSDEVLLLIEGNTNRLIEQSKTWSQQTLEYKLNKASENFQHSSRRRKWMVVTCNQLRSS